MSDKYTHTVTDNILTIELLTNRFTHDLVHLMQNEYPIDFLNNHANVIFDLQAIKMIDSTSIGYLMELHNKFSESDKSQLEISVGDNSELKDLLHKFQIDMVLTIR